MSKEMKVRLKTIVRECIRNNIPVKQPSVIVASMGRSGSTLVYSSVVSGMAKKRFFRWSTKLEGLVRNVSWNLRNTQFKNGQVYKTHDFPCELRINRELRIIFVFGSAMEAVKSVVHCEEVYGRQWINDHFKHLYACGDIDQIQDFDVLRLGEQLESWFHYDSLPVLRLKYDNLWDDGVEDLLSRYCGFSVRLPKRMARRSKKFGAEFSEQKLEQTYSQLEVNVSNLPGLSFNAKAASILGLKPRTPPRKEAF